MTDARRTVPLSAAVFKIPLTDDPCVRCLRVVGDGNMPLEAAQRLPQGAFAPLARDGSGKCCQDCATADTLQGVLRLHPDWTPCRQVVASFRQESMRLPGMPIGLAYHGVAQASQPGDFEEHYRWLNRCRDRIGEILLDLGLQELRALSELKRELEKTANA